jgi:tetratricopeptide (TPR) repeat protein
MGGFKCYERLKENDVISEGLHELTDMFKLFYPFQIEKCRNFLNLGEYENAIDYIKTKVNIKHFEIFKILAICNLVYEGDYTAASTNIDKMWEALIAQEPKNPELYYKNSQVFARICDRRIDIVKKCDKMIDRALEFSPKNTSYLIEKGYYYILLSDIERAYKYLSQAKEIDSNSKESSYYLIFCKIISNRLKEAEEDISYLKEVFSCVKIPIHPKLKYYKALIIVIKGGKEDIIEQLINEALNDHIKMVYSQLYNKYDILIESEFDFLLDLAKCK